MIIEKDNKYENMRNRFRNNLIPEPHTSNDYFFQAALECKEQEMNLEESIGRILNIYKDWEKSKTFSKRTWKSIERQIVGVFRN